MTTLRLELNVDGAAMSNATWRQELADILERTAGQLRHGWYATMNDLPTVRNSNGKTIGGWEVMLDEYDQRTTWAGLLDKLPDQTWVQDLALKVEVYDWGGHDGLRVWITPKGQDAGENGHPWQRTITVERLRDDRWEGVGEFDGDEPDPTPWGLLGAAYAATIEAANEEEGS